MKVLAGFVALGDALAEDFGIGGEKGEGGRGVVGT